VAKRPRLLKVDPEMQRWCDALIDEISTWPRVSSRPMFGLIGFYRGKNIFAAVPRTRAVGTSSSLLLKLPPARQARVKKASGPGAGWVTFEMQSSDDIPEALRLLERAYEKAAPRGSAKR
jgi:TfoX/Sxy family transcriptional regulator of competence genes